MSTIQRCATFDGPRHLTVDEVPSADPGPDRLVVEIAFCGICGTDIHAFATGSSLSPAVCGHEWAGTVAKVGSDVQSIAEGDRVIVSVPPACGTCDPCRAGHSDYCQAVLLTQLGLDPSAPSHGGFSTEIEVGPGRVQPTLDTLSDVQAAQIEPATVTYHAVVRSGIRVGDTVVVQGAGPIGLLTLQWARAAGAATIIVVEPSAGRRALAQSLGADAAIPAGDEVRAYVEDHTGGLGADVVYECVGRPETIQGAVDLVRRGGAASIIGLAGSPATIDPASWLIKEVTVTAALAYLHHEFALVQDMVARGAVHLESMHDHTVGLDDLQSTLETLAGGASPHTKVLVDPQKVNSAVTDPVLPSIATMFDMTGQVAVVTGAGRGIGAGIARCFASAGASVVVAARRTHEIEAVADAIAGAGGRCVAHTTDVTDDDAVESLAERAVSEFGSLTCWVNNAGGSRVRKRLIHQSREEWETSLSLNLSSVWSCTKIAASRMDVGSILNISSLAAFGPVPKSGHYAAAKRAVNSLTETFAIELAPRIRVNGIAPGHVPTEVMMDALGIGEDDLDMLLEASDIPAGRLGTPEDIGAAALYLCAPSGAWITGQTIRVSGGR